MIVKVGGKVKAAVQMDNDMRDEGMGLIHCANKGDTLVIHAIPRGGVLTVSKESSDYQFNCSLTEKWNEYNAKFSGARTEPTTRRTLAASVL